MAMTKETDEVSRAEDLHDIFDSEDLQDIEEVFREAVERLDRGTLYERTVRVLKIRRLYHFFKLANQH